MKKYSSKQLEARKGSVTVKIYAINPGEPNEQFRRFHRFVGPQACKTELSEFLSQSAQLRIAHKFGLQAGIVELVCDPLRF